MKISFHGAAREVTGSCYCIETRRSRVLIDCGLFQGPSYAEARNFADFGFDPSTIDAVIVTHAHLDHVGRLPKLVKQGFRGAIYATPPTRDIAGIVLENAEVVMEDERRREGRPKLYEAKDVEHVMTRIKAADYTHWVEIGDLKFRFRDAGHIFGSAFIEVEEKDGARVVFSGDLGNRDAPFLRPTAQPIGADAIIIESTYGNRLHEDVGTRAQKMREIIQSTVAQNGVLLIPAFAVERTQELLYELHDLQEEGLLPKLDIYLDSPMGIRISEVIKRYPQYYDHKAFQQVVMGDDMFNLPELHKTLLKDQSKLINDAPRPKVIIAGAGMMNGGRILHHLVRYLSDPRSTVLIVGYQSSGTLGRRLYTGEKVVTVLNERVHVKARIVSLGAYSAHADQRKLIDWLRAAASPPKHVYCTHGEEDAAIALASRVTEDLGIQADVPRFHDTITV